MAAKKSELSARDIRNIKDKGRHQVGGVPGLMLQVSKTGSKSWILRVTIGKRRSDIGIGGHPEVSLALAREKAKEVRQSIKNGEDPLVSRKEKKQALIKSQLQQITFEELATQCHAIKKQEFTNDKHSQQWINTLKEHAFPIIGNLPIDSIDKNDVLKVLEEIWSDKTETATRVRQRIATVFDYALAREVRTKANPAHWKGCLKLLLPEPQKLKKKKGKADIHHPALPYALIHDFMDDLIKIHTMTALALRFSILCGMRSGEVRFLKWSEMTSDLTRIIIPGIRMKGGREHTIPISLAATTVLKHVKESKKTESSRYDSPYVFENTKGNPLSDATIGKLIRTMNDKRIKGNLTPYIDPKQNNRVATPHGFRSTFKDWVSENTRYSDEASELALAHVSSDRTRAAYARSGLIDERTKLMQDWGDFCLNNKVVINS